jgi:hypothetical protein
VIPDHGVEEKLLEAGEKVIRPLLKWYMIRLTITGATVTDSTPPTPG